MKSFTGSGGGAQDLSALDASDERKMSETASENIGQKAVYRGLYISRSIQASRCGKQTSKRSIQIQEAVNDLVRRMAWENLAGVCEGANS